MHRRARRKWNWQEGDGPREWKRERRIEEKQGEGNVVGRMQGKHGREGS